MSHAASPSVLLVDNHDLFRAGLRRLLEGEHVRVVGDCRADDATIDIVRRTHPSVVLIDTTTTGNGNNTVVSRLTREFKTLGVIVFTKSTSDMDIYQSLRSGARGYVLKDTAIDDLAGAIRAVHNGSACLSPEIATTVVNFIRTGNVPRPSAGNLSERELDVLCLIAQGYDNNQIGEQLEISAKTVKNHVSSLFVKLDLTNRVQAAVYAVRRGLV